MSATNTANEVTELSALSGSFAAVQAATDTVSPKDLAGADNVKERRIDLDSLPPEYKEALEADEFILFGKASVEQFDRGNPTEGQPPQRLEMQALMDALPQFLEDGGLISFGHQDVKVGELKESHTLDEDATFDVGDETLSFQAGDTLETHVEDNEFWIAADIGNDTYFERKIRVLSLAGVLDGFSVTIVAREWEEMPDGEHVTALDWHSVTIGTGDKILNPDAEFGVAEFKSQPLGDFVAAWKQLQADDGHSGRRPEDLDPANVHTQPTLQQKLTESLHMGLLSGMFQGLGGKPDFGRALESAQKKAEDGDLSKKEAVRRVFEEQTFEDVDQEAVLNAMDDSPGAETDSEDASQKEDDEEEMPDEEEEEDEEDDAESLIHKLASELDMDPQEVKARLAGGGESDSASKSDDEEAADDEEVDTKEEGDDETEYVTEDELDEKTDQLKSDIVEEIGSKLETEVSDGLSELSEKMEGTSTPDPASGSTHDGIDLDAQLKEYAETKPERQA